MSTFKLATIYLFWIVIVALTLNVFNAYSDIGKPSLSFLDISTYEKFLDPALEISNHTAIIDHASVNSSGIKTFNSGFVGINTDSIFKGLGNLLVPFLLLLLVIPPFFFLMKKNMNKALRLRFSVLILWVIGLIGFIFLTAQYGLTEGAVLSSSAKLIFAFLSLACFSYALWLLFSVYNSYSSNGAKEYVKQLSSILKYFVPVLMGLLMIETLLLFRDIAVLFPIFPKTGGYWISPEITKGIINSGVSSLFAGEISLRFMQRLLSYAILAFIFVMRYKSRSLPDMLKSKKSIKLLTKLVGFQILLSMISYFLLDLTFVGYLHHITSLVILVVTIRMVAITSVRGVNLKFHNPKIELNRFSLDVPIIEK
ncbi:MAG: hypothetical protein ACI8XB_002159 [Patiriisocius sp.]|jgi:hypothetical protein